jgi:hypothetical protein
MASRMVLHRVSFSPLLSKISQRKPMPPQKPPCSYPLWSNDTLVPHSLHELAIGELRNCIACCAVVHFSFLALWSDLLRIVAEAGRRVSASSEANGYTLELNSFEMLGSRATTTRHFFLVSFQSRRFERGASDVPHGVEPSHGVCSVKESSHGTITWRD